MQHQQIGADRGKLRGGLRIERARGAAVDTEQGRRKRGRQLERDEGGQHHEVERPQSGEAAHHHHPGIGHRGEPVDIGIGDDEAAQDEEEVDEQVGVADEGHLLDVAHGREMVERDEQRADPAPSVEGGETSRQ